jgi:hypothetical protein
LRLYAPKSVADLYSAPEQVMSDAADEIERLRRKIHYLYEVLEYITDMPDGWEEDEELNLMFVVDNHIKAAREALEENA